MSNSCKNLKISYDGGIAERCSLVSLTRIVHERKINWTFPVLTSTTTSYDECVPPIYLRRRQQVMDYLFVQCCKLLKQFITEHGNVLYSSFFSSWTKDNFLRRMFVKSELIESKAYESCNMYYFIQDVTKQTPSSFKEHIEIIHFKNGNLIDLTEFLKTRYYYFGMSLIKQ